KSERLTFPPRLEIRQKSPDFHIPTAPTATLTSQLPKRLHIPGMNVACSRQLHFIDFEWERMLALKA
ncbi:MAG: hypothetical protein ABSA41_20460, partial [Terriglobia bacterium]